MSVDPAAPGGGDGGAGPVVLRGHLQVPPEQLAAVTAALPEHEALSRAEPGCLEFRVETDADDPCRWRVFERFVDRAAFEAHQVRVKASEWGRVSAGAERHYTVTG